MDSSSIDKIIGSAVERARDMKHEYCTLEHLTLCLIEHKKISDLMKDLKVDDV